MSKTNKEQQSSPTPEIKFSPKSMERMMLDLNRLLEDKGFESEEEANAYLQELKNVQQIPRARPRTPLEEAQGLIYDAWEEPGKKKRVQMARRALEISPDCADAYVLLAEETAKTPEKALELYTQGVQAGERALGAETFKECEGHFWGIITTRPYMRARAGLAECLWALDRRKEAIQHYTDMLRLNPGDNQGLRYLLLHCLIEEGEDVAARKLWRKYKDDASADWLYTGALLTFREKGTTSQANRSLEKALKWNPLVPAYMLGVMKIPSRLPETIRLRGPEEAIYYTADALRIWIETPGAMDWMVERIMALLPEILAKEGLDGPLPEA